MEVSSRGGKWWRLKYRFGGKEKRLSLGTYPDVSLSEARDKRRDFRKMLDGGQDPSQARKKRPWNVPRVKPSSPSPWSGTTVSSTPCPSPTGYPCFIALKRTCSPGWGIGRSTN
ncbi:Arm DNA-binding domain-containing protein [Pseudodesulfovibrio methanolicus]|uniref:Arm DNA-binding domain-containing protein n=1 Tax=Pseudodesulfovibrio methanolicus TaxID=3126690 RepID=A0ABZ2J0Y2_9BACT